MMTSNKPYLIRAFYEWIADNGLTPYIQVRANTPGCIVPQEYVRDGMVVFNIAMSVVNGLTLGNDMIEFKARFSGVSRHLYIPVAAIAAIYAKENGQGVPFPEEAVSSSAESQPPRRGKPHLKLVD